MLRLRFHEGLPIRTIAQLWSMDAAALHHEYARARTEFKAALLEVMTSYHPGSPAAAERASPGQGVVLEGHVPLHAKAAKPLVLEVALRVNDRGLELLEMRPSDCWAAHCAPPLAQVH